MTEMQLYTKNARHMIFKNAPDEILEKIEARVVEEAVKDPTMHIELKRIPGVLVISVFPPVDPKAKPPASGSCGCCDGSCPTQ